MLDDAPVGGGGLAGGSSPSSLLQDALAGAAVAETPRTTARAIVEACVRRLKAKAGGFYSLDLSIGAYVPFIPPEGVTEVEVPVRSLDVPNEQISDLNRFLSAAKGGAGGAVAGVAVYALRGDSCIGVLRLDGLGQGGIDPQTRADLFAITRLLGLVYENEFAFNLLTKLQKPLDVNKADRDFFDSIAKLIKEASGMEYVALREHRGKKLVCIALDGFGDQPELSEWDFDDLSEYEDFETALFTKTTVPAGRLDPKRHAALMSHRWSKNVRSFVAVPVKVGNEVFGVLSVAARCEFDYSEVELRGFESIANAVGVSITNFRNSRRLGVRIGEQLETVMAVTGLEVARSVKHEAHNYATIANTGLRNLWVKLGRPEHDPDIVYVSKALSDLDLVLKQITAAPSSVAPGDWERVNLGEIWEQARTAVAGRLQQAKIEVRAPQGDAEVLARPDWLRQVFLNLLLNSIEAFQDGKKTGRRIDFQINPPSQRAREIQATYSDNATGINPHRLQVPPGSPDLPVEQRIFQEGVTSKHGGSGFGLWLVRHVLDDHHASIDLSNYRGGVTFVLRFPRPEEAEAMLARSA